MKKAFSSMVKAIEITKRYSPVEVKKLSELFLYLNDIEIEEEGTGKEYKYGVSAKGLRKLLNPLTKSGKQQKFDDWRAGVSNIARLKSGIDYTEVFTTISKTFGTTYSLSISENSENDNMKVESKKSGGVVPVKDKDYIVTLRAGEYCATLTKGDAGDLYRKFIFDIKDEFIRLVFRRGSSIDARVKFTTAIHSLPGIAALPQKESSSIYAYFTNYVYEKIKSIGMTAEEYKQKNSIKKQETAKHYFDKEGLIDLERVEGDLATIIKFTRPGTREELEKVIDKFFNEI